MVNELKIYPQKENSFFTQVKLILPIYVKILAIIKLLIKGESAQLRKMQMPNNRPT